MSLKKQRPTDNRVIATIAREHGPQIFEQVIKAVVAGAVVQDEVLSEKAEKKIKKPSLGKRIASAALVRVATRSVPGAIIVSGGLIAKLLHDRYQAKQKPLAGLLAKPRK